MSPRRTTVSTSYRQNENGIWWIKTEDDAVFLANFNARIVLDRTIDDGSEEPRRVFDVVGTIDGRTHRFQVTPAEFASGSWALEHLGAAAILGTGVVRQHLARAIQETSAPVPLEQAYGHTGWRQVEGEWVYLHGGGAIGASGEVPGVRVDLDDELRRMVLPPPPETVLDERAAVRASLGFLELAPSRVTVPIYAGTWRAPIGVTDFAIVLSGLTGTGKSELAALAQQHSGAGMNARNLPASWTSTANANERILYQAKDAVIVIDDFAPSGSTLDIQRQHRDAERIIRGAGNAAGRARMRADGTLRRTFRPRCLVIVTGEDAPGQESLRARTALVELRPGDVNFERLTLAQTDAADGLYAAAMAGFLQWMAADYADTIARTRERFERYRRKAADPRAHHRTPEIVANLMVGIRTFLDYATELGAITHAEARDVRRMAWRTLLELGREQRAHHAAANPPTFYLDLIRNGLGMGLIHLASTSGHVPEHPRELGWRIQLADHGTRPVPMSQGDRIGWIDDDGVYLDPTSAYAFAQRRAQQLGVPIALPPVTLHKRLADQGLLVQRDTTRQRLTVRKRLEGQVRTVLHLRTDPFLDAPEA